MRWLATFARPARWRACCSIRSSAWYILDRRDRASHSARYLARALGRPATWGDVYRHLLTFSATVLDRVYLLQERFDLFRFEASGVEAILEPFAPRRRRARLRRPSRQLRGAAHDRPREGPARGDDHVRGQRAPDQRDARRARAARRAAHDRARPHRRDAVDPALARRRRRRRPARRPQPARQFAALEGDRAALSRRAGVLPRRPVPARGDAAPKGRFHGRPLPRRPRLRSALRRARRFHAPSRRRRGERRRARRGGPGRDAALRRDARRPVPRGALQLVQLLRLLGRCRDADLRRARRPERRRFLAATLAALGLAAALALAPRAAAAPKRSTSAR